jgi:membrane protease YdiL (CAAX protease family)
VETENGHSLTPVMPQTPQRPDVTVPTWRWWEAIVVFLLATVVGGILAAPGLAATDSNKLSDLILSVCGEIGLGGTTFLWLWFLHRRSIRAVGLPKERAAREIAIGALAGFAIYIVGVFIVGSLVVTLLQHASHHDVESPRQLPEHLRSLEVLLAGFAVLVLAPAAEELFFRGFLFNALRARHRFAFAAIVSAICFGAVHYQGGAWQDALLLPIVMCFVGFGLAWLYERRRNIVANIAAHATFNVIGFIFIVSFNR